MKSKSNEQTLEVFAAHQTRIDIAVGKGDGTKFFEIEIENTPEENKQS